MLVCMKYIPTGYIVLLNVYINEVHTRSIIVEHKRAASIASNDDDVRSFGQQNDEFRSKS